MKKYLYVNPLAKHLIATKKEILISLMLICSVAAKAQTTWNTNGNIATSTMWIGTSNSYDLLFKTNLVERLRIKTNGYVGIGVANPLQRLDVNGNVRVRGTFIC